MANKTKNELIMDIENLTKKLNEKEEELIKYEQIAACANMGDEYKLVYDYYIQAGFTEEQAFKLLEITVDRTVTNFMNDIRYRHRTSYRPYR